jgi:hypothetical protein
VKPQVTGPGSGARPTPPGTGDAVSAMAAVVTAATCPTAGDQGPVALTGGKEPSPTGDTEAAALPEIGPPVSSITRVTAATAMPPDARQPLSRQI